MERTLVERCALSGSDLKIKFRTILLTSIPNCHAPYITSSIAILRFSNLQAERDCIIVLWFSKNDLVS